jgi:hypothetical protein
LNDDLLLFFYRVVEVGLYAEKGEADADHEKKGTFVHYTLKGV